MTNRLVIGVLCLASSQSVMATPLCGRFDNSLGFSIVLSASQKPAHYSLTIGDVTVRVEDHKAEGMRHCLLFDDIDILIPAIPVVGEEFHCGGSRVIVESYQQHLVVRDRELSDVYVLKVYTSAFVQVGDRVIRRGGNRQSVEELYYSSQEGLLGFTLNQNTFLRD